MAPPPDDYGWAYIDPQRATASADGPSGSLQFRWGSDAHIPGRFSGSEDLVFYAASDGHKATPHGSGSSLYLYGNMYVTGAIHASSYTIRNITSTEIDISGSTVFGDSSGDTHQRTGSFEVSGPTHLKNTLSVTGAVSPLTSSGEIHASRLVSNDIFTSGSVGVGTSTPTAQPAEKNDLVIGNHTGNRGMTIAAVNTGVGTIRFARSTSANDGEGWIDYSGNSKKMRIGTDGLTTRVVVDSVGTQVTGTLEVSSNTNIAGNAKFGYVNAGTGSTSVTTFYNTLSGAHGAGTTGGDIFADKIFVNDLYLSGSATGITATYVSGTSADPRSYSYEGFEAGGPTGYLKASGSLTLGGEAQIGTLFKMPDNTSAKILVADGTSFQEVAVSGDVSISSAGAVTIANDAVETAMLNDNIISGQTELAHADIADADELMISDGGTLKRVGVDSLRDHYFGVVSGDATVADGGALTIAAGAVEESMVADNAITLAKMAGLARGKFIYGDASGDPAALAAGASGKLLVADANGDPSWTTISGDVTLSAGAVTIANDAVEAAMIADDAVVSAAIADDAVLQAHIADDAVGADQLAANAVVEASIVDNAVTLAKMAGLARGKIIYGDASGDPAALAAGASGKLLVADANGDPSWTTISGDVTLSAGAVTIASAAVESGMVNENVIGSATNLSATAAQADELLIYDANASAGARLKAITISNLEDTVFSNISGNATVAAGGALTIADDAVGVDQIADDAVTAAKLASNAVVNASIADGVINAAKLDIDGSTDIGNALADADLIIVDDGAGGTNRKAALSRVKTYTKTDQSTAGTVEPNKAMILGALSDIDGGLRSVTGSLTCHFKDFKATDNLISDGGLLVSGSATIAAGLSSSLGMAIPDNEHLRFGTSNDLKIFHNGSNNLFVGATGHMRFDNQATGKHIQMDLGADDATTAFQVRNNSGNNLLAVDGVGMQVTGSFEVSGLSHFTSATSHEAGLTSTTMSGSGNLSAHGAAHIGGTLTMDGAGIVFNVANSAGTVNLAVNDGAGADAAITLGKNGKVTKIGDDTPTDGQYLKWDATGGKVAWGSGATPDLSGSDPFYTSTEFRSSGDLKVSGSVTLGGISSGTPASSLFLGLDSNNNIVKAAAGGNWVLEDDDGTEVTVGSNSEIKFIGSGITTNWTDTSDGSDADPYDLTFTVDAAQTGITSLFATDIKIGEDDQTKIDFEDANTINFYANNAKEMVLTENALTPGTNDGTALGTTALGWSDLHIATGGVINFANGEMTITETANDLAIAGGTLTVDGGINIDNILIDANQIFSTGLKVGRDAHNIIDFSTDNEISFQVNNSDEVKLVENILSPYTNDGCALGSTSLGWSDLYLADGGTIYLGNDQDVILLHSPDDGLIIKRTATADDNPPALTLQSGETAITNTDVIGLLQWQAPDEAQGGDGALVVASIEAIATNTFNATQNPTNLVFKTSLDGAAVKHLVLDSEGELKGFASNSETWNINAAGTGSFVQLAVADRLIHTGDPNTFINFAADTIDFHAGTTTQPQMRISSGEIVLNEDSSNRDFRIESNSDTHAFFIDGGDASAFCKVAGGYGSTGVTIGSSGSIAADGFIRSDEDIHTNTYFQGPEIRDAGGNVVLSFDGSNGYIDNDVTIESNTARLDLASKTGETQIGIYGPGGTISDGGNIGRIGWYGTETDGKAGNPAQTAYILVEGDDSAGWTYNSSLGTMMKFAVGMRGTTTLQEVLYLTGYETDYARVGIGTSDPTYKLEVETDASTYIAQFRQHHASGHGIRIRNNDDTAGRHVTFANDGGTNGGHITMDGTTVSYGAFTAYHPAALPEADNDTGYDYGTLVKITSVDSTTHSKSVLYSVEKTTAAQDKAVFGVYSTALGVSYNDDGTEDMESGRHSIFAVGDGHILVCSEGGNIETGDYLCSSNTDGHGMKQSDDILRNYTVAKASEPVDWSTEDSNTKLIACTYHAG